MAALASSNGSGKGMSALRQVAGPSSEGYWGYGIGAAHGVELRSVADEDTKGKPETTGLASKANKKESTTTVKKSKNESKPNPTQTPTSTTVPSKENQIKATKLFDQDLKIQKHQKKQKANGKILADNDLHCDQTDPLIGPPPKKTKTEPNTPGNKPHRIPESGNKPKETPTPMSVSPPKLHSPKQHTDVASLRMRTGVAVSPDASVASPEQPRKTTKEREGAIMKFLCDPKPIGTSKKTNKKRNRASTAVAADKKADIHGQHPTKSIKVPSNVGTKEQSSAGSELQQTPTPTPTDLKDSEKQARLQRKQLLKQKREKKRQRKQISDGSTESPERKSKKIKKVSLQDATPTAAPTAVKPGSTPMMKTKPPAPVTKSPPPAAPIVSAKKALPKKEDRSNVGTVGAVPPKEQAILKKDPETRPKKKMSPLDKAKATGQPQKKIVPVKNTNNTVVDKSVLGKCTKSCLSTGTAVRFICWLVGWLTARCIPLIDRHSMNSHRLTNLESFRCSWSCRSSLYDQRKTQDHHPRDHSGNQDTIQVG